MSDNDHNSARLLSLLHTRVGSINVSTSAEAQRLAEQAHGLVTDLALMIQTNGNSNEKLLRVIDAAMLRYDRRVALVIVRRIERR